MQSGATVKVANNDLRPKQIQSNATSGVLQVAGPAAASTRVMTTPDANFTVARTDAAQSFTGDQTLSTGNLVIGTSGKGIQGTTTNDNANAGVVGELISSSVASLGVSMTTGTPVNVTSISLTAGDWDVSGVVGITNTLGTTTYSYIQYSSSTTSAATGSLGQVGGLTTPSTISAIVDFITPIPTTRYSLSATTTVYLVARAGFAVSNSYAYGVIRARRVR